MPEENVVPLIVKSDDSFAFELWLVVEQGSHHSSHAVTQPGAEVVEDHLGAVAADGPPTSENKNFIVRYSMYTVGYLDLQKYLIFSGPMLPAKLF